MKKIILTFGLSSLLISCGYNKEEQMFYDYVNEGVTNLLSTEAKNIGFKIIGFKKVQEITAKDSLAILEPYFIEKRDNKIRQAQEDVDRNNKFIEDYTKEIQENKVPSMREFYENKIKDYTKDKNFAENTIAIYKGGCEGTFLEPVLNKINEYKSNENKVLSTKYLGKHSIKNPVLNNVEQTIEKYYFTDSTNSKIISSEDVK